METWLRTISFLITVSLVVFPVANHLGFITNIDLEPVTLVKNNEHHIEKVFIKNDGILQAKNVDVFIDKNNMTLRDNLCLEGIINNNFGNNDYIQIHFPKMSIWFECSLTFIGNNYTGIGYALISEQDRNADEWYINKEFYESRVFLFNILIIFAAAVYAIIAFYTIRSWKITPKYRKKLEPTSEFRKYLIEKYGTFLKNHDEKLILAINNGKNTSESLHENLNFHKSYIKNRINFLYKKNILASKDPISLDPYIVQKIKQE